MKKNPFIQWLFAALAVATVTFTGCKNDDEEQFDIPTLEVTPTELSFDENGGPKSFQINTTGTWTITGAEDLEWLAITPALEGTGNAEITVTLDQSATAREAELTVTCFGVYFGIEKEIDAQTVRITQTIGGEAPSTEEFYYSDFDAAPADKTYGDSGDRWPYLDQFDGWQNHTGTGAANVEYDYEAASARNTSNSDSNYSDYEGSGMNNIFFGSDSHFTIGNIAVSTVNLRLTFGAERYLQDADNTFVIEDFDVQLSADGQSWSDPVAYSFPAGANTNGRWNLATADFTLPEGTTTVWIRFTSAVASAHRIDDVRLTGGVGGDLVEFTQGGGSDTPSGESVAITIPEIIAMLTSEQTVLDETNDRTFEAVVVTDKEGGNVNENNLQLMTPGATEAGNGITLYGSGVSNPKDESFDLAKGDRVRVTLKAGKARIVNYSGLYEVTGSKNEEWAVIEKLGSNETITPIAISADELSAYQGMVVTLADMTAPAASALWSEADKYGQHTFTSGGKSVTVFVQSNMPGLVGTQFNGGATGSVTGYATVYRGNGQICPQRPADVAAFMSQTPAITVSPATLSFMVEGGSRTVTVTKLNADDTYTIEASATGGFSASVSGTTVTVTVGANATQGPVTGTLTVSLMKEGAAVSTQTVSLKQAAPVSGNVVSLTKDDIENADRVNEYSNFQVTAADGSVWSGFAMGFGVSKEGNFMPLQLGWNMDTSKNASKSYLKVPSLASNATRISFVINSKTSAERGNKLVVLPADFQYTGQDAAAVEAAAIAVSDPYTGTPELEIDLSGKNVKDFIVRAVGGAVYIDSITIECE